MNLHFCLVSLLKFDFGVMFYKGGKDRTFCFHIPQNLLVAIPDMVYIRKDDEPVGPVQLGYPQWFTHNREKALKQYDQAF